MGSALLNSGEVWPYTSHRRSSVVMSASDMRPSWTRLSAARRRSNLISSRPHTGIPVSKLGSCSCFLSKVLSHCPVIPCAPGSLMSQERQQVSPHPHPPQQPNLTVARWLLRPYTGNWDGLKPLRAKTCSWGYFRPSPLSAGCYKEGGNCPTECVFHWA